MGSPRKNGNTMHLLTPFMDELRRSGCACELIWLHKKDIQPCRACRFCQRDHTVFGCAIHDDMQEVFDSVLRCGLLVLATPIYSWYCTPPMKAALDRPVYGMNKYYGEQKGPALWAGKALRYGSLSASWRTGWRISPSRRCLRSCRGAAILHSAARRIISSTGMP